MGWQAGVLGEGSALNIATVTLLSARFLLAVILPTWDPRRLGAHGLLQ